ncbi:MAG: radical SAM protein [Candidatus Scalindua sp.]|jgi:MoaA/NifB/PqqE/SkfB family radical SAM enzyme|nr:radical SAM protein [Candidatus Scalindua sp.]
MERTVKNEGLILDGTKILYHRERIDAWLRGERIAPITMDIALTRACNYRCEYCYATLQENPRKRITKDIIFSFLDDAAEIGVKAISLVSDGESSFSPIYIDTILRGSENGLSMAMGTNGYLCNRDSLEQILPHMDYLRFNISAGESKRYAEIHGVPESYFYTVCQNIRDAVEIKQRNNLEVTIGLQMVLMPQYQDQIIPLAKLGKELNVDYLVIKHCSDDEKGSLGVQYSEYESLYEILKRAEMFSTDTYYVRAKWSKLKDGNKRRYTQCYGAPFMLQLSGSGLVAPCGMLFGENYKKYWIGNIVETSFKKIWQSDRYWDVMNEIASTNFDARVMCGTLCLQHNVNEFLWDLKKLKIELHDPIAPPPRHINFI